MSARIPDTILLSDLLKATGYVCPTELQGKTFVEATVGESEVQTKEVTTDVPNAPNKQYAYREHDNVVYLKAIPSEDTAEVKVYFPEVTGFFSYETGSYTKETDTIIVGEHEYVRYASGDFTI